MNRWKLFPHALLAVVAAGLIAYPVFAHCGTCAADGKKIAAQLDQNKMTLAKAITAAEEHSKGRAISAITQTNEHGHMALHVHCIAADNAGAPKILMCLVDLTDGKVTGMREVHEFPTVTAQAGPGQAPHGGRAGAAKTIANQTVEAACGACIYKMPGVDGCPLAVKIDGKAYLVQGAKWPNHDYCDRNCQAVVSGRIEGDTFIATKLEAKP
jgi:Family of unknown function (DUF6370)